jgi:DNA invertase Pin-like site-specific DNA recombinase
MLIGYARVSKADAQSNALQVRALKGAGCTRLFEEEEASGGRWERPELHRMLDQIRDGDTVVVWKLDRLSRSLKDVLHIMEKIGKAGAGFRSLTEAIDTTTPAGRVMMQMVSSFAEFERAMIQERTSAGLAAARQASRDRRKRPLRPQVRRRDGAPLRHQPTHCLPDRRSVPRQLGVAFSEEQIWQQALCRFSVLLLLAPLDTPPSLGGDDDSGQRFWFQDGSSYQPIADRIGLAHRPLRPAAHPRSLATPARPFGHRPAFRPAPASAPRPRKTRRKKSSSAVWSPEDME